MSKISKKYFGADQVDGEILKLEKNQAVRGHKQDGSEVEMFGLDLSDNPIVLGSRVALKSQVDDLEGVVQGNFDLQQSDIDGLRSDVDANSSAISTEQSRAEAAEQALDARLDIAEPKITAIESDIADLESFDLELRSDIDDQESYSLDLRSDLDQEILDRQAGDEDTLQSAQDYTDEQIASIPSTDLSNYYNKSEVDAKESALDSRLDIVEPKVSTLESQMSQAQSAISTEQSRAEGAEQALDSRLDIVEPKVSTLESQMSQAQSAISTEQSRAEGAEQALDSRLDIVEPKVSTLESQMSQEVLDRQAGDQSTLESSQNYADSLFGALEQTVESGLNSSLLINGSRGMEGNLIMGDESGTMYKVSGMADGTSSHDAVNKGQLEAGVDEAKAYADQQISAIVDGPSFGRFNALVGATTSEFMLDRQVKAIMSCANGRVALHEGFDFTVSVDPTTGFSKLTFIGPSAAGGASEIESSDQIFVVYSY
jgi:chaperonin cofactor prefoldin